MSERSEANILTSLKYLHEFGARNIYRLKNKEGQSLTSKDKTSENWQTPWLFDEKVTFSKMSSMLSQGASIRTTLLTDDFTYAHYCEEKQKTEQQFIPLYAITPSGVLTVFSSQNLQKTLDKLSDGWQLAALVQNVSQN